ncbi:uncharacterized protein BO96DRAFT_438304 [Aspergillus niger CBS 101883]|uniref:Uncharacterized protein n=3 Tax=Aspergillus niger TaxID=5061 RepID=A2QAF8_ASPNC|nr:uncharacterized protein BO96DRAFT_438304 [Aspergillus niger CBS 101883]XP_059603320.1 hypothetical protein An01g11350 [Aspergillus niger]PYH52019.1 hypothetical protein BO96DRAFT_438304 [Aspergillus niger CBS 101883]RDH14008.1 hypothetical protein M747DRAFT_364943 [Aspergillus niger ATCC 13496]CAK44039.1 hypothetical protein An01g11350 [Aspergillus niger]
MVCCATSGGRPARLNSAFVVEKLIGWKHNSGLINDTDRESGRPRAPFPGLIANPRVVPWLDLRRVGPELSLKESGDELSLDKNSNVSIFFLRSFFPQPDRKYRVTVNVSIAP